MSNLRFCGKSGLGRGRREFDRINRIYGIREEGDCVKKGAPWDRSRSGFAIKSAMHDFFLVLILSKILFCLQSFAHLLVVAAMYWARMFRFRANVRESMT